MLIALAIFGMITAAGVTLLGVTARTQQTSDRLLGEVAELRNLGALLAADLAQAVPRLYRDRDGRPQRAFAGGAGDGPMLLAFVRRGPSTAPAAGRDEAEGGGLQRVGYRLRDGRLERLSHARIDGGGEAIAAPLLGGVERVRLRYRDDEGEWRDRWDSSDPTRMPRAIELVTASAAHGTVRQLFLVGTGEERR
jgi:general secretion pathway protein J